MKKQEILLKEYEVSQQHLNIMMSHYWTLFGVFMPVSTALLGAVPYIILNFNKPQLLILALGSGIIIILFCLKFYFNRVNAMISADYFRMREIETKLGMFKNLYIHELDHWDEKQLDNEVIGAQEIGNQLNQYTYLKTAPIHNISPFDKALNPLNLY